VLLKVRDGLGRAVFANLKIFFGQASYRMATLVRHHYIDDDGSGSYAECGGWDSGIGRRGGLIGLGKQRNGE
jgi:hypothetical protein